MPKRDPNFSNWAMTEEGVRAIVLPGKYKSQYLEDRLVQAAESAWNAARKLYTRGTPKSDEDFAAEEMEAGDE